MNYPSIDFAGQYDQYATFNNYSQYYQQFSHEATASASTSGFPSSTSPRTPTPPPPTPTPSAPKPMPRLARDQVAAEAVSAQHTIRQLEASSQGHPP